VRHREANDLKGRCSGGRGYPFLVASVSVDRAAAPSRVRRGTARHTCQDSVLYRAGYLRKAHDTLRHSPGGVQLHVVNHIESDPLYRYGVKNTKEMAKKMLAYSDQSGLRLPQTHTFLTSHTLLPLFCLSTVSKAGTGCRDAKWEQRPLFAQPGLGWL